MLKFFSYILDEFRYDKNIKLSENKIKTKSSEKNKQLFNNSSIPWKNI